MKKIVSIGSKLNHTGIPFSVTKWPFETRYIEEIQQDFEDDNRKCLFNLKKIIFHGAEFVSLTERSVLLRGIIRSRKVVVRSIKPKIATFHKKDCHSFR